MAEYLIYSSSLALTFSLHKSFRSLVDLACLLVRCVPINKHTRLLVRSFLLQIINKKLRSFREREATNLFEIKAAILLLLLTLPRRTATLRSRIGPWRPSIMRRLLEKKAH